MNHFPAIIMIALATVTASLFGLVLIPDWQMDSFVAVEATTPDGSKVIYPRPLDDWREKPGRDLYRGLGCIYCHSQQVRPEGFGADLERGWGQRRSVPLDYILQRPPFTGTMRTGPDLSNIGMRQPSEQWHFLHLYDPQITSKGSVMPPFKFLFTESDQDSVPDIGAIELPGGGQGSPKWIIPNEEAKQLVAYLKSLKQELSLDDLQ
ncbi:Cytochrome C oxidase, mono-heme subunit/FixO [Novipirellula aureliae]|uniref:Cytochrome C oxidase, mono-heme subunit/FixO n=1 Tax=Novipirellula aureliae TaxID=2527966 RepID=A0A5C6EE67_9BACT|nr:cbb3-type cytochrome c oxidase subunit II [Novipirellula aureliae]TWU45836.1 Cytochrome C oxidase, mono-heme subunit/FixO [Novipirellula aureliae]